MNSYVGSSVAVMAVLRSLMPGFGVAVAVWIGLKLLRFNGRVRHAIWWAAMVAAVCVTLGFVVHDSGTVRYTRPTVVRQASVPVYYPPLRTIRRVAVVTAPLNPPANPGSLHVQAGRWSGNLIGLYLLLALGWLGRLAWGYWRLRGMKRRAWDAPAELKDRLRGWRAARGVRRDIGLLVSSELTIPLATGYLHPAILLPTRLLGLLDSTEIDHVLLHELAHLARRDDWTNLLGRSIQAIFWFHPVVHWALNRIEREREIACDEWVVANTDDPRPYASSLTRLFEFCVSQRHDALAAGMASHGSHLGDRIEELMHRRKQIERMPVLRAVVCAAVFAMCVGITANVPRISVLAWQGQTMSPAQSAIISAPFRQGDRQSFLSAVVAAGYGDLSVDDIINLRNSGISPSYLLDMSHAGWGKLPPRDLIALHNSGVDADYLKGLAESETPGLTVQTAIGLHNRNVSVKWLLAMRQAGFKNTDTHDLISAYTNGLSPSDLEEARHFGAELSLQQIVRLKQAGVLGR